MVSCVSETSFPTSRLSPRWGTSAGTGGSRGPGKPLCLHGSATAILACSTLIEVKCCRAILFSHPADFTVRAAPFWGLTAVVPDAHSIWLKDTAATLTIHVLQPVCTTEIGRLAIKYEELSKMGVKLATISCDKVCFSIQCDGHDDFVCPDQSPKS